MTDEQRTPNVWVVRADGGKQTERCVGGGFTGIGWEEAGDLSGLPDRALVDARWRPLASPDDKPGTIRSTIDSLARFLLEVRIGDWVITPETDLRWLRHGQVIGHYRYDPAPSDGCPYRHRRDVIWQARPLYRYEFTKGFRDAFKQPTVIRIRREVEFFERIGFAVRKSGSATGK